MSWDIFSKSKIQYFLQKLKDKFVQKEAGKGLSTNDFTNEDKALIGQILGNNTILTTDKTPFLTRQTLNPTGFSGYVREKLVGASYAWNQLCENGDFSNGNTGWNGNRGSWTVSSGVGSFLATGTPAYGTYNNVPRISGHKYLAIADIKLTSASASSNVRFRFYCGTEAFVNLESNTSWQRKAVIVNAPSTASDSNIGIIDARSSGWDAVQVDNAQIIDLTLAFGSTIADYLYGLSNNGGITKLRDMGFPIDKYTPYGYGLYSVKTSGKKIAFDNQLDGNAFADEIVAKVSGATKDTSAKTVTYLASNLNGVELMRLPFKENTRYTFYFSCTGATNLQVMYTNGTVTNFTANTFVTTEANKTIKYIGGVWLTGSTVLKYEECGCFEGVVDTFKPYAPVTYSLGNDELRGKFDLVNGEIVASGDVKESNGGIARNRKRIELNSVNYTYNSTNAYFYTGDIADRKYGNNILCLSSNYTDVGDKSASDMASVANMSMASNNNNVQIKFKNTAYTDATAFKNAMAGVYLEYDLATPTIEQSTPFADPMSLVGATTEEYIDTRDIPCPVGAERQYMGQSADVIPIPSKPHADGVSMLMCASSGGKEQYYWDASFMQAFQSGCDEIMGAVAAKGITPASNSPDDISAAISQIPSLPSNMAIQIVTMTSDVTSFTVDYNKNKTVEFVIAIPLALVGANYEQTFLVGKLNFLSGSFDQYAGTTINYNSSAEQMQTAANAGSMSFNSSTGKITINTRGSSYKFKSGDIYAVLIVYSIT